LPSRADVKCDIETGSPREVILASAERACADLLVLGSHGAHDAHKGIGPTAAACVQRAGMPVLLVREDHAGPFRGVVACLDFTETSKLALRHAIRVAAQDGAALHILHMYDDGALRPPAGVELNMPDFKARYCRVSRTACAVRPPHGELNALKAEFHCLSPRARRRYGNAPFGSSKARATGALGTRPVERP
jgi:nucleotide-binding universal stress UspA family protein